MSKYLNLLKNVRSKQDVDIALDLFIRQLSNNGIEGISLKEAEQIGQLTTVFFRYYQNVFLDDLKVNLLQRKMVKVFKEHIDDKLTVEMSKVLNYFPVEIINELRKQRHINKLEIINDIKDMEHIGNIFVESAKPIIYNSLFTNRNKKNEDEETLALMREKISIENLEHIDNKTQEFMEQFKDNMYPKTKQTIEMMEEDINQIQAEIELIVEQGGPDLRPRQFSDMTIEQWISVLDDAELFDYTADIKIASSEKIKDKQQVKKEESVPEYIHQELDVEKSKKIELDLLYTKKSKEIQSKPIIKSEVSTIVESSARIESPIPADTPHTETPLDLKKDIIQNEEPIQSEPEAQHYNPMNVASELRKKHKDKYSI
ncbi:MAG: hypothetical protein A2Y40_00590 [Candidatus Margulisbacteria bacterium GWF2_35_9]|nr:MAG: hypothetical protein A2Y40_00590 [Candidatus Margulisbacteria bacterium GWF2_35_9]